MCRRKKTKSKSGKSLRLKLPLGWDRLRPSELVVQLKEVNNLKEEDPDYAGWTIRLDKIEKGGRNKLPPNWEVISVQAAELLDEILFADQLLFVEKAEQVCFLG